MDTGGFLHDKMDVKILILFILSRIETPLPLEDIYAVAYQDDSLNYFVLVEGVEELTRSEHIRKDDSGCYSITEKGRIQGGYVEDSLAIPVARKVTAAIQAKKDQIKRENLLSGSVVQDENGRWIATLRYRDGDMPIMSVSLMAPDRQTGEVMVKNMKRNIDMLYKANMDCAAGAGERRGDGQ